MKYTNSHLKAAYGIYLIVLYIFIVFLIFGTFLLGFGFMKTKMQLDNVQPLENVLQEKSNHANKTAYIEIIQIPQKISEDKYESIVNFSFAFHDNPCRDISHSQWFLPLPISGCSITDK